MRENQRIALRKTKNNVEIILLQLCVLGGVGVTFAYVCIASYKTSH